MLRIHIILALAMLAVSCGSSRQSARPETTTPSTMSLPPTALSRDSAVAIMKRLETSPLAAGAAAERHRAFEWLTSSEELGGLAIDGRYLKPLEDSDYPFAGELLLQFAFGMAMHRMTPDGYESAHEEQVEAGLRSVIATYRNMVQADINLGSKFLEDLDQIRRLGRLREYIAKVDEQNR